MRISRAQAFMETAWVWAKRSTCMRLNVGAIVVYKNNILAQGYNGPPAGQPHCQGNECPGKNHCKIAVHAEYNAIKRVPTGHYDSLDVYVTHSPCLDCAKFILGQDRIDRIFFAIPYRLTDGIDLLSIYREVYKVTPAGYVINYPSNNVVEMP
jgi:dCMP deaminase